MVGCKRVLEAAKVAYVNKTKESIFSQKLGTQDFWQIAKSVLSKDISAIPPLFNSPKVLSSASDKAKSFAKNFPKNSNLDDLGISLPDFAARTNLKLNMLTPKIKGPNEIWFIKGVWSWLYSSCGSEELWAWNFLHTIWTLQ